MRTPKPAATAAGGGLLSLRLLFLDLHGIGAAHSQERRALREVAGGHERLRVQFPARLRELDLLRRAPFQLRNLAPQRLGKASVRRRYDSH